MYIYRYAYDVVCFTVRIGLAGTALQNDLGELWFILNWYACVYEQVRGCSGE